MPRSWPGYTAPLVALVVTLLLVVFQTTVLEWALADEDTVSPALLLAGLLGLAAPFVVAALWGGAFLLGRPPALVLVMALAWLAAGLGISSGLVVWPLACYVLAGLAAGVALGFRFRLDAAIAVVTVALLPYFIWTYLEFPAEQQYDQFVEQYMEARREMLAGTADPKQVELTLAAEKEQQEQLARMALKILPSMFGLGVVGFSGVILVVVWIFSRLLGVTAGVPRLPAFGRWRLPFYLVWVLVAGLGLFITRQPYLATTGINLALAVATLLSVQGAAVQWTISGRSMGVIPRLIYLAVAGFLFLPLVVLGLADQWLDFRKLEKPSSEDSPDDDQRQ